MTPRQRVGVGVLQDGDPLVGTGGEEKERRLDSKQRNYYSSLSCRATWIGGES
jgi:hypothetical protein